MKEKIYQLKIFYFFNCYIFYKYSMNNLSKLFRNYTVIRIDYSIQDSCIYNT